MLKMTVKTTLTLAMSLMTVSALAATMAPATQINMQFSNVRAVSPAVNLDQCIALFADTAVSVLSKDKAHGKVPVVTAANTEVITKNFSIMELSVVEYAAHTAHHPLMEDRTLVGQAQVSFDDGKTFATMPIVVNNTTTLATDISIGNIVVGNGCFADIKMTPIKAKA